jgi:PleD family two-component response regulator
MVIKIEFVFPRLPPACSKLRNDRTTIISRSSIRSVNNRVDVLTCGGNDFAVAHAAEERLQARCYRNISRMWTSKG